MDPDIPAASAIQSFKSLPPQKRAELMQLFIQSAVARPTFRTQQAQRLLAPDYDAGLISHSDYLFASESLESMRFYSDYLNKGGTTATNVTLTTLLYMLLPNRRKLSMAGKGIAIIGLTVTSSLVTYSAFSMTVFAKCNNFWTGVESPLGVAQAIRNAKSRVEMTEGSQNESGNGDSFGETAFDTDFKQDQPASPAPVAAVSAPPPLPPFSPSTARGAADSSGSEPSSAAPAPLSRWDEIRAKSNKASPSSWDDLRQKHERSRTPDTSDGPKDDPPQ